MLEIYNENLRDLLVDSRGGVNKLDILATQASGCNVPGATQVRCGVPLCWVARVQQPANATCRSRHYKSHYQLQMP